MKTYILTDDPYHDNETIFGAFSSLEKARDYAIQFASKPENKHLGLPVRLVELEIDGDSEPVVHELGEYLKAPSKGLTPPLLHERIRRLVE